MGGEKNIAPQGSDSPGGWNSRKASRPELFKVGCLRAGIGGEESLVGKANVPALPHCEKGGARDGKTIRTKSGAHQRGKERTLKNTNSWPGTQGKAGLFDDGRKIKRPKPNRTNAASATGKSVRILGDQWKSGSKARGYSTAVSSSMAFLGTGSPILVQ